MLDLSPGKGTSFKETDMDSKDELTAVLRSIPWFEGLSPEHFEKMAAISRIVRKEAGQMLFHEGDKEDYLYIVLEGRVAIETAVPGRGHIRIITAEPMEVVGWSSVTPVIHRRVAGARAVLPSCLAALDAPALSRLCDEDHDFGYLFMRLMANVIANRLLSTRLQLLDMFAAPNPAEEANQ
jgi:CRP-like cAMP-binding protein